MPAEPADLHNLLQCTRRALRSANSAHGAALVERVCVTGSLGRGTYTTGSEATGLVLFLNVDLQFSPHEVPKALDALAASLRAGQTFDDQTFEVVELQIADAKCRGGLWAHLHVRRRNPGDAAAAASAAAAVVTPGSGSGAGASDGPSGGQNGLGAGAEATPGPGAPLVLQLFLSENMTSSVTAQTGLKGDNDPDGGDRLSVAPVDEHKAAQQQQNLMVAAEQRLRREARYQARHGRATAAAAAAVPAAAWAAKTACGLAEARRIFWARQPEAARRAARGAHKLWRQAIDVGEAQQHGQGQEGKQQQQQAKATGQGGCGPGAAAVGDGPGGSDALWSDEVMHMLDVLALYAYQEVHGQCAPPQPQQQQTAGEAPMGEASTAAVTAGEAAASASEDVVVAQLFTFLSTDYANRGGMRVALQGGMLAGNGESNAPGIEDATVGDVKGPGAGSEEPRLVVLDPCFPVLDLHAAACEVVGQGEEAGGGLRRLRRLAAAAARLAGTSNGVVRLAAVA